VPWLPIRLYRDFYDVPRAFLVERAGTVLLFDCPFDDAADDYPDRYRVYRMPPDALTTAAQGSWVELWRQGQFLTEVPVAAVQFDTTRRVAADVPSLDAE